MTDMKHFNLGLKFYVNEDQTKGKSVRFWVTDTESKIAKIECFWRARLWREVMRSSHDEVVYEEYEGRGNTPEQAVAVAQHSCVMAHLKERTK